MSFDLLLLQFVLQLRRPWLDDVMVAVSAIGAGGYVWFVIAAIACVFPERRTAAWRVFLTIWFTYFTVDWILKPLIFRTRPFDTVQAVQLLDQRPIDASFPSGHAAMAFASAFALSRMFPSAWWVFWPLAVVIAFSRVYLGVHWPSDVIGGMIVGLATATFVLGGYRGSAVDRSQEQKDF